MPRPEDSLDCTTCGVIVELTVSAKKAFSPIVKRLWVVVKSYGTRASQSTAEQGSISKMDGIRGLVFGHLDATCLLGSSLAPRVWKKVASCSVRRCALYVLRPLEQPHTTLWIASGIEPDVAAMMPWYAFGPGRQNSSDFASFREAHCGRRRLFPPSDLKASILAESRITLMAMRQKDLG